MPPEPLYEQQASSPGDGSVWIDGYWHWNGYEWVWVNGRWEREQAGYVYVEPNYDYVGEQFIYTPGYWSRPDRIPHGWAIRDHRNGRPTIVAPPRGNGGYRPPIGGGTIGRPSRPPVTNPGGVITPPGEPGRPQRPPVFNPRGGGEHQRPPTDLGPIGGRPIRGIRGAPAAGGMAPPAATQTQTPATQPPTAQPPTGGAINVPGPAPLRGRDLYRPPRPSPGGYRPPVPSQPPAGGYRPPAPMQPPAGGYRPPAPAQPPVGGPITQPAPTGAPIWVNPGPPPSHAGGAAPPPPMGGPTHVIPQGPGVFRPSPGAGGQVWRPTAVQPPPAVHPPTPTAPPPSGGTAHPTQAPPPSAPPPPAAPARDHTAPQRHR
jgi:hypothetical protein